MRRLPRIELRCLTSAFLAVTFLLLGSTHLHAQSLEQEIELPVLDPPSKPIPPIEEFINTTTQPKWDKESLGRRLKYPVSARKRGVQGSVIIQVLVDASGVGRKYVFKARVDEDLDQAALEAVKGVVFEPARSDGTAVACWVQIVVNFNLVD